MTGFLSIRVTSNKELTKQNGKPFDFNQDKAYCCPKNKVLCKVKGLKKFDKILKFDMVLTTI